MLPQIYVSNLPHEVTEAELRTYLHDAGSGYRSITEPFDYKPKSAARADYLDVPLEALVVCKASDLALSTISLEPVVADAFPLTSYSSSVRSVMPEEDVVTVSVTTTSHPLPTSSRSGSIGGTAGERQGWDLLPEDVVCNLFYDFMPGCLLPQRLSAMEPADPHDDREVCVVAH